MPLSEVNPRFLQQTEPGLHKRWFADEELDVTIWQEEDSGRISHFQIVLHGSEMVEWDSLKGLRVGRLQSGAEERLMKGARTYLLASATDPAMLARVKAEFTSAGGAIAPNVFDFVIATLDGNADRMAGVPFEPLAAAAAQPAARPEGRALHIGLMTPHAILRSLRLMESDGWELRAVSRRFCLFEKGAGSSLREMRYEMRNITFLLPHQILAVLNTTGRGGLRLAGAGGSYLFLESSAAEARLEYRMDSITLRGRGGVRRLIEREEKEGWTLSALGFNFAFFSREEGSRVPGEHKVIACSQLGMPARTEERLEALIGSEAVDGFHVRALGSGLLVLARP